VPEPERRKYDSPVRRRQAAETRERIVAAGSALVHGFERWDWRELTVRAVAREAGISERTVYRHFADETALRDAVMQRLHEEAGVSVEGLEVERFGELTGRVFAYLASFEAKPRPFGDPTFAATDQAIRDALVAAVAPATTGWPATDRALAAAVLDVLLSLPTYERLTGAWGLEPEQAARAARWVIGLVEQALAEGRRPPRTAAPAAQGRTSGKVS
jgi:AcrR family transcriptional regulator